MSMDTEKASVPGFIPVIAGGVSGVLTRLVCQPLDVLKIRFQLQVEPIKRGSFESKYRSIPQAVALIVKEEGLQALWKGHVPAQALSLMYGVIQFGVYEAMVKEAKRSPQLADKNIKVEFLCGFTAGSAATILSFPFDIVRTRLIAQGNNKMYSNMLQGLGHIWRTEGVVGWWRGLTPTLLQIGPLSGIQFAAYQFYKRLFQDSGWEGATLSTSAIAGSLAGFSAKVFTYPLDLTRKRMQLQGFQNARKGYGKNFTCSSLRNCVTETVRGERASGLFKGLFPSLLKASIVNGLIFCIYENTHKVLCNIYEVQR